MKKRIFSGLIIILLCGLFSGCDNIHYIETNNPNFREWVSPDGVHYWVYANGGMIPRLDENGNYVIDK